MIRSNPDMSIRDAATYLKLNPDTIRKMIADNRLPAYRIGKTIRLRRSEIDAAMKEMGSHKAERDRKAEEVRASARTRMKAARAALKAAREREDEQAQAETLR
jgi:excisionase family DNA binding protein